MVTERVGHKGEGVAQSQPPATGSIPADGASGPAGLTRGEARVHEPRFDSSAPRPQAVMGASSVLRFAATAAEAMAAAQAAAPTLIAATDVQKEFVPSGQFLSQFEVADALAARGIPQGIIVYLDIVSMIDRKLSVSPSFQPGYPRLRNDGAGSTPEQMDVDEIKQLNHDMGVALLRLADLMGKVGIRHLDRNEVQVSEIQIRDGSQKGADFTPSVLFEMAGNYLQRGGDTRGQTLALAMAGLAAIDQVVSALAKGDSESKHLAQESLIRVHDIFDTILDMFPENKQTRTVSQLEGLSEDVRTELRMYGRIVKAMEVSIPRLDEGKVEWICGIVIEQLRLLERHPQFVDVLFPQLRNLAVVIAAGDLGMGDLARIPLARTVADSLIGANFSRKSAGSSDPVMADLYRVSSAAYFADRERENAKIERLKAMNLNVHNLERAVRDRMFLANLEENPVDKGVQLVECYELCNDTIKSERDPVGRVRAHLLMAEAAKQLENSGPEESRVIAANTYAIQMMEAAKVYVEIYESGAIGVMRTGLTRESIMLLAIECADKAIIKFAGQKNEGQTKIANDFRASVVSRHIRERLFAEILRDMRTADIDGLDRIIEGLDGQLRRTEGQNKNDDLKIIYEDMIARLRIASMLMSEQTGIIITARDLRGVLFARDMGVAATELVSMISRERPRMLGPEIARLHERAAELIRARSAERLKVEVKR